MTTISRRPRQGAPRADRRGDDGLQARARGDGRRPRGGASGCCARRAWRGRPSAPSARRPRASSATGSPSGKGTLVAVGCETEPVSKNDDFQAFAEKVLETVVAGRPGRGRGARRRSGRSSSPSSARTSRSSARRSSRATTIVALRPPAGEQDRRDRPGARRLRASTHATSRCTSRSRGRATSTRDQVPAAEVEARARDPRGAGRRRRRSRSRCARRSSRAGSRSGSPSPVLLDQPWFRDPGQTVGQAIGDMRGPRLRRLRARGSATGDRAQRGSRDPRPPSGASS